MTDSKTLSVHPNNYAECWSDDERMNFYFSAFPSTRSDNPHHWDSKMKFWVDLIHKMSENNPYAYISWDNLFSKLRRNGKEPLGMNTVFTNLLSKKELVSLNQYMQDVKPDETWVGWGVKWCVKKPASWVVGQVLSPVKSDPRKMMKSVKFICMDSLEKKCRVLFSLLSEYVSKNKSHDYHISNIVSFSTLYEIAGEFLCDTESVDIVLETMRNKKLIEIWPHHGTDSSSVAADSCLREKYVKFGESYQKAPIFTEADVAVVQLCETKSVLEHQIENYHAQISDAVLKTKEYLRNQQKSRALNTIKKKKRLEKVLLNKEKALSNQEEILERLHQCKTDKMVMETYKSAIAAYKNLSSGISAEDVQETMDEVSSVLDNQSEMTEALSETIYEQADLSELEDELAKLVQNEQSDDLSELCVHLESTQLNDRLPKVPCDSPTKQDIPVKNDSLEKRLVFE